MVLTCDADEICSDATYVDLGPVLSGIDVIGEHEFWTHELAEKGDDVGQVKFFNLEPLTQIVIFT